jgi:hypothetical protein
MKAYSREELQGMKGVYDEQIRIQFVDQVCATIRQDVLQSAQKGLGEFVYDLCRRYGGIVPEKSRRDILDKLGNMFPGCSISSETISCPFNGHTSDKDVVIISWK